MKVRIETLGPVRDALGGGHCLYFEAFVEGLQRRSDLDAAHAELKRAKDDGSELRLEVGSCDRAESLLEEPIAITGWSSGREKRHGLPIGERVGVITVKTKSGELKLPVVMTPELEAAWQERAELRLSIVRPLPPPPPEPLWDEVAVKEINHRDEIRGSMVVIESPFMGGAAIAELYARLAMREQLLLGSTPFASHLLYPQALDDADPQQRRQGIRCGWAPYAVGARCEVYTDLGITIGMAEGIEQARRLGCTITHRAFGAELRDEVLRKAHLSTSPGFLEGKDARSSVIVWP